ARRSPLGDHPGDLQLAVRPGDRVRVDHELVGEYPDGRQLLAGREPPRRHQVLHLVDDLEVDRHPVVRRDVDVHGGPRVPRIVALYETIDTVQTPPVDRHFSEGGGKNENRRSPRSPVYSGGVDEAPSDERWYVGRERIPVALRAPGGRPAVR